MAIAIIEPAEDLMQALILTWQYKLIGVSLSSCAAKRTGVCAETHTRRAPRIELRKRLQNGHSLVVVGL